jgi:hypothetical protein
MRLMLALAGFLVIAAAGGPSQADSEIPFPQLKTEMYCSELVSKMLNKDEQKIELEKCLVEEKDLKAKLQPYWPIVRAAFREKIMEYYTEPQFETYRAAYGYVAQEIGSACVDKLIACSPPN